jgi:hypothetical protein
LAKRIIINLETDLNINHALTKLLSLKVVPLIFIRKFLITNTLESAPLNLFKPRHRWL